MSPKQSAEDEGITARLSDNQPGEAAAKSLTPGLYATLYIPSNRAPAGSLWQLPVLANHPKSAQTDGNFEAKQCFASVRGTNMFRKISSFLFASLLVVVSVGVSVRADARDNTNDTVRVQEPLNIAILIQDDLISRVGNELGVTRQFIRALPAGSRVMVGYITTGSLQVRQPFTNDLNRAANSLRIPAGSTAASPYNPYVEVIEGLKNFDSSWKGHNAVLLISDGLDTSRGFDATAAGHTLDIDRTISEANRRNVAIFSFYAPSVGLTSHSYLASSYGQSSLNRVSDQTGGKAFFQGTTGFVTFDSYFSRLTRELNRVYATAS